jgi:two-component system, OmpR family, KDP operon response regulator KdpE
VVVADCAAQGEHYARLHRPDVAIVDLGLADRDGLTVIAAIRKWSPMPILVLSARTAESQRLAVFDQGADDYIGKPFSAPELVARVRASARRHARGDLPMGILEFGAVVVDLGKRVAHHRDGREFRLTPTEHRILETLTRHRERIVRHVGWAEDITASDISHADYPYWRTSGCRRLDYGGASNSSRSS